MENNNKNEIKSENINIPLLDSYDLTEEEESRVRDYFAFGYMNYAQTYKQVIKDLQKSGGSSSSFTLYSKESLSSYLRSPESNEKAIRNASIHMFNNSSHYRALVLQYALMPLWQYVLSPVKYDPDKVKPDNLRKQYFKIAGLVENMNLKHEMQKANTVAVREGVLFGAIWANSDSFFIQRINPDICVINSMAYGVYNYSVDFSQIKENDLKFYPPEFTDLWNEYKVDGIKYKEIPEKISFCLKVDMSTPNYSLPLWASVLPLIYDIENYKELQDTAREISNYKLLGMTVPTDEKGIPTMDYDTALKYYKHMSNALPPHIGLGMTPMKLEAFDFEKGRSVRESTEVEDAVREFFAATGTSPLLFGDASNNTAGALRYSIKANEAIVFSMISQCERLVNRYLKLQSGTIKFKVNFLPATIYNSEEITKLYKEGSSYGLPVKSLYAASLGLEPCDILGLNTIELDILEMDKLTPLATSFTQSGKSEAGRPTNEEVGEPLSESGEVTRDTDANSNR